MITSIYHTLNSSKSLNTSSSSSSSSNLDNTPSPLIASVYAFFNFLLNSLPVMSSRFNGQAFTTYSSRYASYSVSYAKLNPIFSQFLLGDFSKDSMISSFSFSFSASLKLMFLILSTSLIRLASSVVAGPFTKLSQMSNDFSPLQ